VLQKFQKLALCLCFVLSACSSGTTTLPTAITNQGISGKSTARAGTARFVPAPPLSEIRKWESLESKCSSHDDQQRCNRKTRVCRHQKGRSRQSTRSGQDFIDFTECFVSEPEFFDPSTQTIYGAELTCYEFVGVDNDPFGYRDPNQTIGAVATPPPTCNIPGANAHINGLVAGDPAAQSILAADQLRRGSATSINLKAGAGPDTPTGTTTAQAQLANNSIDWYSDSVATAVAKGTSEAQLIAHEGLHLFDELIDPNTGLRNNPFPGNPGFQDTRIVTLTDGTLLIYNIAASGLQLNTSYTGYDHFLIHDQLVSLYGTDRTSALRQAFAQADSVQLPGKSATKMTPAQAEAAAATRADMHATALAPVPPAAALAGCNGAPAAAPAAHSRHASSLDFIDGFYVDWDGETSG